jgi:hypothetical protein
MFFSRTGRDAQLPANSQSQLAAAVAVSPYLLNDLFVSKVEQVECELRKLSQAELRQIREWLDDIIEDNLQFTPEFEDSIQRSERDMASGKSARVREPEHD